MVLKNALKGINSIVNRLALAIVILIVFAIFVSPLFYSRKEVKEVKNELKEIGKALESYNAEKHSWPSTGPSSVAAALKETFYQHGKVDAKKRFIDPWDSEYRFFFSNDGYAIQSAGPDKEFADGEGSGTDDYWYSKSFRSRR